MIIRALRTILTKYPHLQLAHIKSAATYKWYPGGPVYPAINMQLILEETTQSFYITDIPQILSILETKHNKYIHLIILSQRSKIDETECIITLC